jgi:translation initiation factor 1 (eIF-1/SUI1)
MKNCKKDVIRGWELANLDPEAFDMQIISVSEACKNCEYLDRCGTPSESMRQLAPKSGQVVPLGCEKARGGESVCYFSFINQEEVRYIRLKEPKHYWATASYIPEEQVPLGMLNLAE